MLSSTLIDELGYLPIDKSGADLLFQVISQRYERGATILTTNQPFKSWPKVFNNDATLASAERARTRSAAFTQKSSKPYPLFKPPVLYAFPTAGQHPLHVETITAERRAHLRFVAVARVLGLVRLSALERNFDYFPTDRNLDA